MNNEIDFKALILKECPRCENSQENEEMERNLNVNDVDTQTSAAAPARHSFLSNHMCRIILRNMIQVSAKWNLWVQSAL